MSLIQQKSGISRVLGFVLANKLGITDEEEMEALESGLLLMLMNSYLSRASRQRCWHLSTSVGGIANGWGMCMYDWAGRLRKCQPD